MPSPPGSLLWYSLGLMSLYLCFYNTLILPLSKLYCPYFTVIACYDLSFVPLTLPSTPNISKMGSNLILFSHHGLAHILGNFRTSSTVHGILQARTLGWVAPTLPADSLPSESPGMPSKGPDNNYFTVCRPDGLCCNLLTKLLYHESNHKQYINNT